VRERRSSRWPVVLGCLLGLVAILAWGAMAGDDVWTTNGPGVAGGLFCLKADPTDAQRVYCAGFSPLFGDSLFYWSSDGGLTWQNSWGGFPPAVQSVAMGPAAVVVHPSGPDTLYLMVNLTVGRTLFMRSTDYGASWGIVPSAIDTFVVRESSLLDSDLEICPTDPLYLYAGVTAGALSPGWGMLRYTTDGGVNWNAPSSVMGLPDPDSLPPVNCVAIDPSNELVAYAGLDSTLIKTTDGGDTWFIPNTSVLEWKDITRIVVSPWDSDLVYAGAGGPFPVTDGGVYRSTDGGTNWEHILTYVSPDTVQIFGIGVAPDMADWVYAASRRKVYLSANGGDHWVTLSESGYIPSSQAMDVAEGQEVYLASGNNVDLFWVFDYTVTDSMGPLFWDMWHWPDTSYPGPYEIRINIKDEGYGLWEETLKLYWHRGHDPQGHHAPHGDPSWTELDLSAVNDTTYFTNIPIQGDTGIISYYAYGMDNLLFESFFPESAPEDTVYHFHLRFDDGVSDGGSEIARPRVFYLGQNSPNPVIGSTEISYALPKGGRVGLSVYNITGELVRILLDEPQSPNWYTVTWDGRDDRGKSVASGVYFYRLTVPDHSMTRKMIVLR